MSRSLRIKAISNLEGEARVPGDKSISHRVAMLASIAEGRSRIKGFATSADCHSTLDCLRRLGINMEVRGETVVIDGAGLRGYSQPVNNQKLDAGNSGSTIRMLSGILAAQSFTSEIDGDASLRRRPMRRIIEPLALMGAKIEAASDTFPPLVIHGSDLRAIEYESSMASAQVKSCVLLAGLHAEGRTVFREPARSRNHTEIMLKEFGANISADESSNSISVEGGLKLTARDYEVPGDVSSAAFLVAAASVLTESKLLLRDVGLNPTRTAFLDVLREMGAKIERHNLRERHGEMVGDLFVSGGELRISGSELLLEGEIIPNIIDELPILAVVASQAEGRIVVRQARELRVKESDRIRSIVDAMKAMSGEMEEYDDGFAINGPQRLAGGRIKTGGDHRIAMAFAVAALAAKGSTEIEEADCAGVSFPEFYETINSLAGGRALE